MKKLTLLFLASIAALTVAADVPLIRAITTSFNLRVTLAPNGQLDAVPLWTQTGPGTLQVDANGFGATLVSTTAGTNTITISATSQGNALSQQLVVTITAPPPPATTLGVIATPIPK